MILNQAQLHTHSIIPLIKLLLLKLGKMKLFKELNIYVDQSIISEFWISFNRWCFRLLAQTTLRNILGTKNLHEILSDRESIAGSMQVKLKIWTHQYKYSDHALETLFIISRQYWMKPLTTGELKLRELRCKLIPTGIYTFDKNIKWKH